jgi:hypothetical protein
MPGICYFIQPAEFIGTNKYKIGMSRNKNMNRIKNGYKKGTLWINVAEVADPVGIEKLIKKSFKKKFTLVSGYEYFSGNETEMLYEFIRIICFDKSKNNNADNIIKIQKWWIENVKKENKKQNDNLYYVSCIGCDKLFSHNSVLFKHLKYNCKEIYTRKYKINFWKKEYMKKLWIKKCKKRYFLNWQKQWIKHIEEKDKRDRRHSNKNKLSCIACGWLFLHESVLIKHIKYNCNERFIKRDKKDFLTKRYIEKLRIKKCKKRYFLNWQKWWINYIEKRNEIINCVIPNNIQINNFGSETLNNIDTKHLLKSINNTNRIPLDYIQLKYIDTPENRNIFLFDEGDDQIYVLIGRKWKKMDKIKALNYILVGSIDNINDLNKKIITDEKIQEKINKKLDVIEEENKKNIYQIMRLQKILLDDNNYSLLKKNFYSTNGKVS